MDWIDLAQVRDSWGTFVNEVMEFRVKKGGGWEISCLAEYLIAAQEELFFLGLVS